MDGWSLGVLGGMVGVIAWAGYEGVTLLRAIDQKLGRANEMLSAMSQALAASESRAAGEHLARSLKGLGARGSNDVS